MFYRAQTKGYTFPEMQLFISADGGDGLETVGGLCATSSAYALLHNTVMAAMNDDDDVVIFTGVELAEVYDGYRVRPVREVARYTIAEFRARWEEIEEEVEGGR